MSARVGVTADFRPTSARQGPTSWGEIGLDTLTDAGVEWEYLPAVEGPLPAELVDGLDAVLVGSPKVDAATVAGDPPLLLARFGVGYDSVDVAACTAAGVGVTITPDGARRPVAAAALALLLAVQHNLVVKDRLVRESRWSEKSNWHGQGLTGRTVGIVGLGNVGAQLARLLAPMEVTLLATDPARTPEQAAEVGAELVDLDTLMAGSDAVVLLAALTPETQGCVNAERLGSMRAGSVLVNIARGGLVDTDALLAALQDGPLRAAALDVFDPEPLPPDHPLLSRDDVVLAPHAIAWTDEMAAGNGGSAVQAILDAVEGRVPAYLVDPAVTATPRWTEHRSR